MKKIFMMALFFSFALVVACGEDDPVQPTTAPTADAMADCTCPNFKSIVGAFEGSVDLRAVVQDPLTLPVTVNFYTPSTGEFSIALDVNGDRVADGSLTGTVRNPQLFYDGIQINEAIVAEWDLRFGNIRGSGVFSTVKLGASSYRLTIVDVNPHLTGGPCDFEITSLGLHYDLQNLEPRGPWGSMEFKTSTGSYVMTGLMTVSQDVDRVSVSATYDGKSIDFEIDMNTFQVVR